MSIFKKLSLTAIVILSGCADFSTTPEFKWRPYLDIDNTTQYMDFFQRVVSDKDQGRLDIPYASAIKKSKFGDLDTYKEIGDAYPLVDENKYAMGAIFLIDDKSFNPYSKSDAEQLTKTKSLDYYEFGKGRIARAKFLSSAALCKDFNSSKGVKINIATTYYEDYQNYYASQISANLNVKGIKDLNYTPHFNFADKVLEQKAQIEEKKVGKDIAERNLKERIALLHFICE
ncbi:MAG: hypothetical protein SOX56_09155 [[Pasteurella] mairii]|uniref:Lipoprotein-2 n=1 Tax=[Pasteurella] mairii TaxID=757 RepID=A0A379B1W7_9PAST|nr:hypothetical protein [[Pasteurella] mairii]SUB32613.1 lipoprotein-2 [[Pasteurella] mairii]